MSAFKKETEDKEKRQITGAPYMVMDAFISSFPRDTAAVHTQRPSKSSVLTDRTDSGWKTITYLRGGTQ